MNPPSPLVSTLAHWLAGEFDNRPQALDQPVWFVHLRLWHRPLPIQIENNLAIFAEQANALYLDRAYRQRVLVLQEPAPGQLCVQYRAFKQPERFRGAGANPDLLKTLTPDDLDHLPGCELTVRQENDQSNDRFVAEPEPNVRCYFQYEGKTRQVVLGFAVSDRQFLSYDRGVDPDTGQALWGATMGAYEFAKQQDFSGELPG